MVKEMENKKSKWDGRSRPADDVYRKRWNEIFNKKEKTLSELLREGYEEEKAQEDDQ
jgi:hypothetical protein